MFQVSAYGATHVGQVRPVNQDSFLVSTEKNLFIVADGMGGHAGGEVASGLAIQTCEAFMSSSEGTTSALEKAIKAASSKIYEESLLRYELYGMGTTVTMLHILHSQAFVGHVGDSRLYLCRKGFLYQMTLDHSLVSEHVRAGKLSIEEAKHHKLRNMITRSVGFQEEEMVDTYVFSLEDGDHILMCSDGLYTKVSDQEISLLVAREGLASVSKLIDLANERGGQDNISVIVIHIGKIIN